MTNIITITNNDVPAILFFIKSSKFIISSQCKTLITLLKPIKQPTDRNPLSLASLSSYRLAHVKP